MPIRPLACLLVLTAACGADTDSITIDLAPDVISSLDGTLSVHARAFAEREPAEGETIQITVDYTDRNGAAHTIDPVEGTSSPAGDFDAVLSGFSFDGTGIVTARILAGSEPLMANGGPVEASATFAVLDRTPPTVTITPPAQVRIGNDVRVDVHVTDEIGISQVFFESDQGNGNNRDRGTVVASGATDTTVTFEFQVGDGAQAGSTITLYALAADLSGNQAAATPVSVTVQP